MPATRPLRRAGTRRKDGDLTPDEELLIAARQALDDPHTVEHLRRTRPRIERLLGLLAHRYKARKHATWAPPKPASRPPGPPP